MTDRDSVPDEPRASPGKVSTSRREFMEGVVGTWVSATAIAAAPASTAIAAAAPASAATPNPPAPVPAPVQAADYPPSLQGIRGQIQSAMEAGHALRDGAAMPTPEQLDEQYDLVVVGAGMSGLAAAYFFHKAQPNAKILILEGCDDFGGHARRNEFNVGGRQVVSAGGTYMIMFPTTYTPEGKALLADIGVNADRYYDAVTASAKLTERYPLVPAAFFDRETYGVDRLVDNAKDFTGLSSNFAESTTTWAEFLARTPLSHATKQDIQRLVDDRVDHMPGLSVEEKIKRLRGQSYAEYLNKTLNIRPETMAYFQNQMGAALLNVGAGPDSFSAWRAYNAHYPGFAGMHLPPIRVSDIVRNDQLAPDIHMPDGNAGLARLLVRWLIPSALPGNSMEDSVVPHVNYGLLDRPENDVRIRLSSTVVNAEHDGDPATAQTVYVTYMKDGKARRIKAATCVMACFNAIVPYVCPQLPETQKQALHRLVRKPLVLTTVAVTNWRAFAKHNIQMISSPSSFYYLALLDLGFNLGGYRGSMSPDEPATIMMMHAPSFPGMPARDQYRAGRAKLMQYTLDDYKHHAYDQLSRALGPSGFDPQRDIAGVTVNRWAHAYACGDNDLYDPDWTPAESSWVKGRQRFGR
ncbi:MAG TPA: NAD(P)-binding protein, partial [Steroidobacteraceae bacterium]|nr:NAD(P)-binding protein [Steroidobacteraceae bacterium]